MSPLVPIPALVLAALTPAAHPSPSSPGGQHRTRDVATRCPTFSWAAVAQADGDGRGQGTRLSTVVYSRSK